MKIKYLNSRGNFKLDKADENSYLYFPIGNDADVMACVTPNLHGDNKIGQNSFLLEPVSVEGLHMTNNGRNVWFRINKKTVWAANGCSPLQVLAKQDESEEKKDFVTVEAGRLWHKMTRENASLGIAVTVLSYAPIGHQAEMMKVTAQNIGRDKLTIEPTVAIPLYGRSADNIRDHRHVTSLLHRTFVRKNGIEVKPTLSFDERGHVKNNVSYGVYTLDEEGKAPISFYPVLESFIGEGGNLTYPKAVVDQTYGKSIAMYEGDKVEGFESIAAMKMDKVVLKPGETKEYYIILSYNNQGLELLNPENEKRVFEETVRYWEEQLGIEVETGNKEFDQWLKWVGIQPTLRRIYGCSFLPHHDYGRGGRGYRDLWQDSLALLLNSKESIRNQLLSYYGGVRIDGSNATIIGKEPGDFIADRNSIVRMWMDHGVWPCMTTLLYINQTGDYEILLEETSYFKDRIIHRGTEMDGLWQEDSKVLHTHTNEIYKGTILEHILVQNLTAFYDVGDHGHMRLLGADWNDALDMAKENGESVAFSAAYAGNLENLGKLLLRLYKEKDWKKVALCTELMELIGNDPNIYKSVEKKREILKNYCNNCGSYISGKKEWISCEILAKDLLEKAEQIKKNIRSKEWIATGEEELGGWFNSYYDNNKNKVEGIFESGIRMMLTGQVFTILSRTATDQQISMIVKAADRLLFDDKIGGYRLNTNFNELKTDLGRMFGFAYGSKENGSVFSHMTVMYANALYSRGFVKEGYRALNQLFLQAADFESSRIYPGIPEYFNQNGRGLYNYLTGSASWYMLTVLTEMFGVKGDLGDLVIEPKLMACQFDKEGYAKISFYFARRKLLL
ncbi:MAG: cellobiose phosphorylase, partial [Bacillota bacterium]|nr:cellobiose phosphorylase [Bacillota bacterium]